MAALGECLAFYLTYPAELDYVCNSAPTDLHLPDAERVVAITREICERANEEAADLLAMCADTIAKHFRKSCRVGVPSKRAFVKRNWYVSLDLSTDSSEIVCSLGVQIKEDAASLVPWLYMSGGKKAEERAARILGNLVHSRSGEGFVRDRGCVALGAIRIFPPNHTGFKVDCDAVLAEVDRCFARFKKGHIHALLEVND